MDYKDNKIQYNNINHISDIRLLTTHEEDGKKYNIGVVDRFFYLKDIYVTYQYVNRLDVNGQVKS